MEENLPAVQERIKRLKAITENLTDIMNEDSAAIRERIRQKKAQVTIRVPQYRTTAAEYKLNALNLGEVISRIIFELYETREINREMDPLHRRAYMPHSKLFGGIGYLSIETEAGVAYLVDEKPFGDNRRRITLGELTFGEEAEKDEMIFRINKIDDLNLDPWGIMQIAEDPRYKL